MTLNGHILRMLKNAAVKFHFLIFNWWRAIDDAIFTRDSDMNDVIKKRFVHNSSFIIHFQQLLINNNNNNNGAFNILPA